MNEQIRARRVRVVDQNGKMIGILPIEEALTLAYDQGVDLVEVAPNAHPPVCRLMDYGKYRYEQQKKSREARRQQRETVVKEIRMRPNIDHHDFQVRVRQAQKFLREGAKVKVTLQFHGREVVHAELGVRVLERFVDALGDEVHVERQPTMEGRNLFMTLAAKK